MNMRTRSLLTMALTTALFAPVALAQSDTTSSTTDQSQTTSATTTADQSADQSASSKSAKGTSWADLDSDRDGRISASEASANAGFNSRFSVIDADGDGYATEAEYRGYAANAKTPGDGGQEGATASTSWADLDTDDDGRISTMEASSNAGLNSNFASIDSDGDGYLTDSEYRSYASASGSASEIPQWDALAELDSDGDGRIGSDELVGFVGTFAAMDADGDGSVTDAEYRASLAASGATGDGRGAWSVMDRNRDGLLSKTEIDGFSDSFKSMDADSDGYVSNSEYASHSRTAAGTEADPERAMGGISSGQSTSAQGGTAGQPMPPTSQGAANAAAHSAVVQRELWNRLDTDRDGRISSVEASLDPEFSGNFSMNDGDSDGFITAAEYRDHAQEMNRGMGGTRSESSDTSKGTMDSDVDDDDDYDDEATGEEEAATPPDDER